MKKTAPVKITPAKGRPMLTWVGKRPLTALPALPAQHVETFDPAGDLESPKDPTGWTEWPDGCPKGGLLFHGDNKEVLAHLLANGFRGKVNLIYIDPPFDSGADYVRKVQLRGAKGVARVDGEAYTLGEQVQYTDIWTNDNYLQFMYERLLLLKELLSDTGSIYVHSDPSKNSYLRIILDEVFGHQNFVNEIVWQRLSAHNDSKRFGVIHDTVYYYSKGGERIWNPPSLPFSKSYIEQFFDSIEEETSRRYSRSDLTARGLRNGETGKPWRGINPAEKGNHWKVPISQLEKWDSENRIHWPKKGGMPRLKRYLDEVEKSGASPQDIWSDIKPMHNQSSEILGFPTQKPEILIERIIDCSSNPGDLILDCFIGSGTTAAVAQKLGRRWIGCDINKGAIQTTAKRLQTIIAEQRKTCAAPRQQSLDGSVDAENDRPLPAQLGFTVWRVNDYDLQIQHNEAVNLACDYIGVERKRSDAYFDGILGKRLVKIVPFTHPLSPLDLDELQRELKARPDEDRDVVLICLGVELAAQSWLEDWNRHRETGVPNRVDVIELRTDPKYAGFIKHDPATARATIARRNNTLKIKIEDFISPTIIKRLDMEQSLFKARIKDWRSQVDCIMIDTDFDGQVFNVALSDAPAKKSDLVSGEYELAAPAQEAEVAVKIIDMLGEEVLVVKKA